MSEKKILNGEIREGTPVLRYTVCGQPTPKYPDEVYLATDNNLNRKVLLQFLPSRYGADAEVKALFIKSAQAAAAVSHPNLLHIYEIAEYEGRPFVAMEYVGDRTLFDLLREGGLSSRHALDIGIQICAGLRSLHEAGIVHYNLRPDQIAVSKTFQVQILLPGHLLWASVPSEEPNEIDTASLEYISPEQAAGEHPDFSSNIFSVGILLYEMFSGLHPFRSRREKDILRAISEAALPPPRDQAKIPSELRLIVEKTLAQNRASRYLRVDYLQDDLECARTVDFLRESEEQYRSVVEQANDGICIIQNQLLKFLNQRLAKMVGYSLEEGLNTNFSDYLPPSEISRIVEKYNLMITGRESSQRYETILVHRDGISVDVEINAVQISFEGHRAVLAIVRDISDRKKTEMALRDSERKFSSLFHFSNDAIFIHDLDGNILDVNRKAVELFGYPKADFMAIKIADLHPSSSREESARGFRQLIENNHVDFEIDFIKAGGEIFPAEVSSGIVEIGGEKIVQGIVRDISQRKQNLHAIKESQRALSTLMNNLPGMAYRCRNDRDWTMEFVSDGCKNLTGYETTEVINNTVISYSDIVHPEDRDRIWNEVQSALEKKYHFQLKYRIVTRDKNEKWVWEQGCGVFSDAGELVALEGFITDISRQKQSEEHLQLLSSIVKQSTEGIALVDIEGNIKYVNKAVAEMHGYSPEELLRKNLAILHTPAQMAEVEMANQRLREAGIFNGEIWHKRRNGSVFPSFMNNSLLYDDAGQPVGMIGIMRDITSRKRAEMELRESEEKYRNLVNLSPDPVIIIQGGMYKLINPAFTELFGYTQQDVDEGLDYLRLAPEKDKENIRRQYENRLPGETIPRSLSVDILTKDGREIACETSATLIQFSGLPAELIIIRDVTERKKAEEALRSAHEQLNATLNALPDLLFEINREGVILDFRAPHPEKLYRPPAEFLGQKMVDCIPQEAAEVVTAGIRETMEKGQSSGLTYSLNMQGKVYWFELSAAARGDLKTPQGRMIFLIRDITDRQLAEEAVKNSEEKYRLLIESAASTITLFDREGRLLLINTLGAKYLGGVPEDFIGRSMQDILPDKAGILLERNRQVLESGVGLEFEDMMVIPGGNRWFLSNLQLINDASGNVIGVQIISNDITDRKLAEMELDKSTRVIEQERNMFIDGPVVVIKWQNRPGWPMEYVSPNVKDILGYDVEELISGRIPYADLIAKDDLARVSDEVAAYGESDVKNFSHQAYRIIRKDGELIWVADYTTILRNNSGIITHYLGYVIDITERVRAEDMLRNRTEQLDLERNELSNKNIALNQILQHIESEKQDYQRQMYKEVEQALAPFLKKLKEKAGPEFLKEYEGLEDIFDAILAKDTDIFAGRYAKLTSRESEICNLIKSGLSSKQISQSLNLSLLTVLKHRELIRRKLGITNKSINLATYLRSH